MQDRQAASGIKTPSYRIRFTRGRGVSTASPLQELQRIEAQVRPVRSVMPQREPDLPVTAPVQPLLRQRWPQGIPTQPLQSIAAAGSHQLTRVQIEPVGVRVARPHRCRRHLLRWLAASPTRAPARGPSANAAFDGGRREHGSLATLDVTGEPAARMRRVTLRAMIATTSATSLARPPPEGMEPHAVPTVREHAVQH